MAPVFERRGPTIGTSLIVSKASKKWIKDCHNFEARSRHFLPYHLRSYFVMFDQLVSGLFFAFVRNPFHDNKNSALVHKPQIGHLFVWSRPQPDPQRTT